MKEKRMKEKRMKERRTRRGTPVSLMLIITTLILLAACGTSQLQEGPSDNHSRAVIPSDNGSENIRPVINKSCTGDECDARYGDGLGDDSYPDSGYDNYETIYPGAPNQSVFLVKHESSLTLRIPLMTAIGEGYPSLDYEELPLLRPAPVRTGDGHIHGYRQYLRFDFDGNSTGNVTFLLDESRSGEHEDYLGTALFFREDLPIFEYALLMEQPFFSNAVIGSAISLLGANYQVTEATNNSLLLQGLDVSQYLRLSNGTSLSTNQHRITDSEVEYDGWKIIYRLLTRDIDEYNGEDGLLLREGESLRDRLDETGTNSALALLSPFFDIRYDGLEPMPPEAYTTVKLEGHEKYVNLVWTDALGENKVPILGYNADGDLWHGDEEHQLHLRECDSRTDGCVKEQDLILLEGRIPDRFGAPGSPVSAVLRVSTIDSDEGMIIFRDAESNRISVDWEGTPGDPRNPAIAKLPFLDREYTLYPINTTVTLDDGSLANVTNRLAVDLDGNGGVNGAEVSLLIAEDLRVSLDPVIGPDPLEVTWNNSVEPLFMNVTIETPPFGRAQRRAADGTLNKEWITLWAVANNGLVQPHVPPQHPGVFDQKMLVEPIDEDESMMLTPWGSLVVLKMDRWKKPHETREDITATVPFVQRFALISIGTLDDLDDPSTGE